MTLPPQEAAKRLFTMWQAQEKPIRRRQQVWKANLMRRKGVTGVVLLKRQDTSEWLVYAPPGMLKQVPALNKANRLCRLLASTIFSDPPEADATPASDSDADRDAAEFATRMLQFMGASNSLDNAGTARRGLDRASSFGSTFRYYWVDPKGGGQQPMALLASQQRVAPLTGASPDEPITDPTTGAAYPPPYVIRYVQQNGMLTDDRNAPGVRKVWVPALRCRLLTGHHVRPLPATAEDISTAHGAMLGEWVTLDELRLRFGKAVTTDPDELKQWAAYRPEKAADSYPGGARNLNAQDDKSVTGETLIWTLCCYFRQTDAYPQGAYVAAVNGSTLLYRQPWLHPKTGEVLPVPIDQLRQMDDEDDFYGRGMMELLGPGNEIRAAVLGGQLEHQDRFLNRKVFLPTTSTFQPRSAQAMTGTYIPINPGGKPEYEIIPDYPAPLQQMFDLISAEMDHESGLEPPVSGENPPSVGSGLHARTIIEQVHIGLADIQQNTIKALERGWMIQMVLASAFYTVPQRVKWVGEDNIYKERLWTGADLGSTRDVRLHQGTLSMLTPSAKAAVAQEMFNTRDPITNESIISLPELRRIVLGGVGGQLGLQDDPARQRIRRQIDQWTQGPPKSWIPKPPAVDPNTGQPVPDPVIAGIWASVPSDEDPATAKTRYLELTRLLNSTNYSRWLEPWKAPVAAEWERMRRASGVVTTADTVAQQQQAAQAQQDAAQQQQTATQQQQAQAATQQQAAAVQAQQAVKTALDAVLKQQQAGDVALSKQMQQFFAEHHKELVRVLASVTEALKPQPQAPPPPPAPAGPSLTIVTGPGGEHEPGEKDQAVAGALAQIGAALQHLASRPTSFRIVESGGKPAGIEPAPAQPEAPPA